MLREANSGDQRLLCMDSGCRRGSETVLEAESLEVQRTPTISPGNPPGVRTNLKAWSQIYSVLIYSYQIVHQFILQGLSEQIRVTNRSLTAGVIPIQDENLERSG